MDLFTGICSRKPQFDLPLRCVKGVGTCQLSCLYLLQLFIAKICKNWISPCPASPRHRAKTNHEGSRLYVVIAGGWSLTNSSPIDPWPMTSQRKRNGNLMSTPFFAGYTHSSPTIHQGLEKIQYQHRQNDDNSTFRI